jgi:hypothetical protein
MFGNAESIFARLLAQLKKTSVEGECPRLTEDFLVSIAGLLRLMAGVDDLPRGGSMYYDRCCMHWRLKPMKICGS